MDPLRKTRGLCCSLLVISAIAELAHGSPAALAKIRRGYQQETPRFKTEPSIMHTYFLVDTLTDDTSLIQDGYLFMTPQYGQLGGKEKGGEDLGPQIRELDGTLVWAAGEIEDYGPHARQRNSIRDFHSCDYHGSKGTHLCWSESVEHETRKHVVLDNKYNLVAELLTPMASTAPDMHEFRMVDDGNSYCDVVFVPRKKDLSLYGGPTVGTYYDGCFQEVSTYTHAALHGWCWSHHLSIWETSIYPLGGTEAAQTKKAGSGLPGSIYDPEHLNSVDKITGDYGGDYLVSARHADQILKIAASNRDNISAGDVIWRLGGVGKTISIEGDAFNFSRQHGVRSVYSTATEDVISILNNAWEGALAPSANRSSGMVIAVNKEALTARLIAEYPQPQGLLVNAMGNMDILSNGNVFVDWGTRAAFSEFTSNGELLYHARFTNDTTPIPNVSAEQRSISYRVWKREWVGQPDWSPKLAVYSRFCKPHDTTPLIAWVSWNGATEVRTWRFSISSDMNGPWVYGGMFAKDGFETRVVLSETPLLKSLTQVMFPRYVSVEALDRHGAVLPNGIRISNTFVPSKSNAKSCGNEDCHDELFDYSNSTLSAAAFCTTKSDDRIPRLVVLVFLIIALEYMDYTWSWIFSFSVVSGSQSRSFMQRHKLRSTSVPPLTSQTG